MDNQEEKQPFLGHLEELRKRLIACVIAVAVGFVGAYFFKERLFHILVSPISPAISEGGHLIFTAPAEMFLTQIKVAFIGGVLIAAPFIFYELWMFVAPGLYQKEKKAVVPLSIFSTILFLCGAFFAYFVVLPIAFKFLLGFETDGTNTLTPVKALISVRQGFSFSLRMLFAFGIAFQLPIVIYFLARMGVVTTEFLKKKRSYAILLTFVAGAVLTPPDIFSQCLLAVPLMLLYEIGIFVAKFAGKKQGDEEEEEEEIQD